MALWVAVHGLKNAEQVEDSVLNRPIYELVERTNYLYGKLQDLAGTGAFESVRVDGVGLVTTGASAPSVGDFVYLDDTQNLYAKAIASPSVMDLFAVVDSGYALGMLVSVTGNLGTVVLYGKCNLSTSNAGWLLSNMLETGETFRNGPYYLSALEAGKMTAEPSGAAIYLGYFMEDPENPGYGGYVMMSPQYKDIKEMHIHRAYAMYARPAGMQVISGTPGQHIPTDTHQIIGYEVDDLSTVVPTDQIPRLVPLGAWLSTDPVQYIIWISNSSSAAEDITTDTTYPPTSWNGTYLHWKSSDALEGKGVVKLWSYETPVAVGTKGFKIALENNLTVGWDEPYLLDPYYGTLDTPGRRTWTIDVPSMAQGWLANKQRKYFDNHVAVDYKCSIMLMNGPMLVSDQRLSDTFTVKCAEIHTIDWTGNANDGETVTLGSVVYEFDDNSVVIAGHIQVAIDTIVPANTYANLMAAILAQAVSGYDVSILETSNKLTLGVPMSATVSVTMANATTTLRSNGFGNFSLNDVALMVYDQNHESLVSPEGYWPNVIFWSPRLLANNLSIMVIPYSSDGTPATGDAVALADYWLSSITDESPGAYFKYAIDMHQSLSSHYPPIPLDVAAMVLNGVELNGYQLFPDTPTYRLSLYNIFWYSNLFDAHHSDIVDYAMQRRVSIVSPTTLMAVFNTARAVMKDVETRKQVHIIKDELGKLGKDFGRFDERMKKLAEHIRQANKDVDDVQISSRKISEQFAKIERVELDIPQAFGQFSITVARFSGF